MGTQITSGPEVVSTRDRISSAVFNNAVWCDAVCRALGCDTDFVAAYGSIAAHRRLLSERGHPDPRRPRWQVRRIRLMTDGGLTAGWSVKDSFSTLDLAAARVRPPVEADWLVFQPAKVRPGDLHGVRMGAGDIRNQSWRPGKRPGAGAPWRHGAPGSPPRIFMRVLLGDPDIVFLAAYRRGRIVGVVAGSRSDHGSGQVAGVSNLVLPARGGEDYRAGAVAAVRSAFPDLPLVSYDSGSDLEAMIRSGSSRWDRSGSGCDRLTISGAATSIAWSGRGRASAHLSGFADCRER